MQTITQAQADEVMDEIAQHILMSIADVHNYYCDIGVLHLASINEQEELETITNILTERTREVFPIICDIVGINEIETE